jgi:Ca-activated chloride channel family protein
MGARLWVRHEFQSQEAKPIEVVYGFMLPRDATLRRFRVSSEGFSVDSDLREKTEAREIYEQGIQSGSLSTLAQQYRDGLVNLTVGNIRPDEKVVVLLELMAGVELRDDGLRLRFPFTLAPSYHVKARVIEAEPGVGEIELPEKEFGDIILPKFIENAKGLHNVGFALDLHVGEGVEEISSPSHSLRVQLSDAHGGRVALARESDLPDRDLVLDVRTKSSGVSLFSGIDHENKGRIAAIIPSTEFGPKPVGARQLVILLDRSGSMRGAPIQQAKKAIAACLATFDEADRFGLVAFDNQVESFHPSLMEATKQNREAAKKFLDGIDARGGTELATGLEAAAAILKSTKSPEDTEPGDIMIFTDGQVFATEEVLERVRSTGARVHSLGIGSASQDRFLSFLAAHSGGVSRFMTPSERVDLAALELFAAISSPVAQDVKAGIDGVGSGRVAPGIPKYVFAGTPLLIFAEAAVGKDATLHLEWKGAQPVGPLRIPVPLAASPLAETLRLLQGARIISDCESRQVPGAGDAAGKRESERYSKLLAQLSREYGLPSSQMSLVAVVKRATDVSGDIPKTQIVPVGLPQDMEFQGVFAGAAAGGPARARIRGTLAQPADAPRSLVVGAGVDAASGVIGTKQVPVKVEPADAFRAFMGGESATPGRPAEEQKLKTPDDLLIVLAGMLDPDGGMPGKNAQQRLVNSLATLLFFVAQGNTRNSGPFRVHVAKLMRFFTLERLQPLNSPEANLVAGVLQAAGVGRTPRGDWNMYAAELANRQEVDQKAFWQAISAPVV